MVHKDKICEAINKNMPDYVSAIREWIRQELGIERSLQLVRIFIKKLGFRYRKTTPFPGGKLSEERFKEQEVFKTETLFPLLRKMACGSADLLFLDSAHFVQGKFERFLWSQNPCYNPTSHGRYRVPSIESMFLADWIWQKDKY
ncbi:hypothetical protein [Chondrinema litorale]|uniref:hypothetical protein n=1 Tax=Chondrinema litorale TaxID=2994555 RepID=UPI002543B6EA|nr:hypothetical protein [Chondrinema litorale]UZR99964.1 hypothetical protein OQ292_39430 [Chondrinema litorale]